MAVTLNASTSSGLVQTADTSGEVNIQSNGTTVLGVTSTGTSVTGTQSVSGNLSFNSGYGSSAVAYGCRAWVNFNGTGTVAIRGSGNVTSITDNGTGDYTVNFTTALPDTNYAISASAARDIATDPLICGPRGNASTYSTSAVRIVTFSDGGTISDSPIVGISVFR